MPSVLPSYRSLFFPYACLYRSFTNVASQSEKDSLHAAEREAQKMMLHNNSIMRKVCYYYLALTLTLTYTITLIPILPFKVTREVEVERSTMAEKSASLQMRMELDAWKEGFTNRSMNRTLYLEQV